MKHIDILFFDATSGHRTAAYALEKALLQIADVKVRVLNLTDVLSPQPFLHMLAKIGVDVFNWFLKREKVWFLNQQFSFFQTIQANVPQFTIQQVADFWRDDPPDMVVSVFPICNLLLERALHQVNPEIPYFIIPVDFEEGKKDYWFDKRLDAYYLNPTRALAKQAENLGIESSRCLRVSGMPIDPLFYDVPVQDKHQVLKALGLNPDYPTVLVTFGGQGSVSVQHCAEQLCDVKTPINAIFLCGRHKQLLNDLQSYSTPYPKAVLGYTPEAPAYYYHLADALIGKPGSMTITEAIVTRTPFLALKSRSLALVQAGNEKWLGQSGVGDVITLDTLPDAVENILKSNLVNLNIEREWHRGIYEIVDVLLGFLQTGTLQTVQTTQVIGERA